MPTERKGVKDSKSRISQKTDRIRSDVMSAPKSKPTSAIADVSAKLDLLVPLDQINFKFDFELHGRGLLAENVIKLARDKLDEWRNDPKTLNDETAQAEIDAVDVSNKRSAVEFLLRNQSHVLVSEFLDVIDGSQPLMTDVLTAVNTYSFGDLQSVILEAVNSLKEAESAYEDLNKQRLADKEASQKIIAEQNARFDELKFELEQLKSKSTPIINVEEPSQGNNNNFQNVFQNSNNAPNNFLQPNNFQSGYNSPNGSVWTTQNENTGGGTAGTADNVMSLIQQLTANVNRMNGFQQQMANRVFSSTPNNNPRAPEPERKPKINAIKPPKFNVNEHRSLRLFATSEFARWAGDQGLTERWSTLWFCQTFSTKEDLDTVFLLAKDEFGNPRFNRITELVDQIISDLCINEETEKELRRIYNNFKWNSKRSIEQNFKWICEQRRLGWPGESSDDALVLIKDLYETEIPQGQGLCGTVYTEIRFGNKWNACTTNYQCQKLLRELQSRFNKDPNSSYYLSNSNKPTNSHSATEKMDISNIEQEVQNIGKDHYKNPDDDAHKKAGNKSKVPQQTQKRTQKQTQKPSSKNINSIEEKECANPKCSTVFKPKLPHFYCCTSKCAREMPVRQRKKEMNAIEKQMNGVRSDTDPDENVSSEFYITPAHVYTPASDIPVVIHDALFDTGAGPTLVTTATLELLKMSHLIKSITSLGFSTGDKSPMKGNIGTIVFDIGVEDSTKYVTERVKMTFDVFEDLNHKFIIGRNTMLNAMRKIEIIPILKTILFNPSLKKTATWNKKLAHRLKTLGLESKLVNNLSDSRPDVVDPDIKVLYETKPEVKPKKGACINNFKFKPKYSDSDTVLLNVPLSKFNKANFERYSSVLDMACNNFMEITEQESTLEEILTAGGLDGLIEKNDISSVDVKTINTAKGELKVGLNISERMEAKFKKFVNEYKGQIFDTTSLGKTKQTCHPEIKPDAKPFSAIPKYMPLNPHMQSEAKKLVEKMCKLGVITETTETANSTIFIVQKSSGKWRLICDLRKYNERCQDFVVHLPSPYELINRIAQFQLFSYVDFPEAYFNVPLSEDSIKNHPIVASVSGCQYNYKYLRMAQGLKVASSNFVSILNTIYAKIMDWCFNYLDDSVLCSSDDEDVHFEKIKEFIKITEEAGLKLSLPKCVFFTKNLTFLNYTITNGSWGISENQRNTINALNCDGLTKDKRESLAAFLNYFNRFHTGVSYAARKIRDLKTSDDSVKSILENVKKRLINSPALKVVNFKEDIHIFTDASKYDCSGVIIQKTKHGTEMVSCFSKKFPANMIDKDIYTKELWTLQQIARSYRYLFIGNHKKIFHCDSRAVLAAKNSKAPSLNVLFSDIKLTFGNVEFKYVESKKNAADIFTRRDINNIELQKLTEINSITTRLPRNRVSKPLSDRIMKTHRDAQCCNGPKLLKTYQDIGYKFLKLTDVMEILSNCDLCKQVENHVRPRPAVPGITLTRERTCTDVVYIDHKKIITKSREAAITDISVANDPDFEPDSDKMTCILTFFEPISGLTWFYPVSSYSTETVKAAIRTYFMLNGITKNIVSDNASTFTALSGWLNEKWNSKLHTTSAYHPNSNLAERAHRNFESALKIFNPDEEVLKYNFMDWQDKLVQVCITHNSMKSVKYHESPFETFKNRTQKDIEPLLFYQTGKEQNMLLQRFEQKVAAQVNSKGKLILPVFKKGQRVKLMVPGKQVEFGIVTATKDDCYKTSVRLSINGARAFGFSKNHIGVPKNGVAVEDTVVAPTVESSTENMLPDDRPVVDLVDEV